MQVSAGQDGIQRLLAAEQEAQKIVAKARKGAHSFVMLECCCLVDRAQFLLMADKQERLKQAKREAEKEIQSYKQQREDAYQKRIKDVGLLLCLCCCPQLAEHWQSRVAFAGQQ